MTFEKCKGSLDQLKVITATVNKLLIIISLFTRIATPSEDALASDTKMAHGAMDKQQYV
jgi:hypothetical protein